MKRSPLPLPVDRTRAPITLGLPLVGIVVIVAFEAGFFLCWALIQFAFWRAGQ